MNYPVYNQQGDKVEEVELNSAIFEVPIKQAVVHQVVVAQLANARHSLAKVKTRGEVSGGGRKPWRQKGTGRARHGSIRSPLWKGGGVVFGPTGRENYTKKVNKKMKRLALFMSLSDKIKAKRLVLLDKLKLKEGKTKGFLQLLETLRTKVNILQNLQLNGRRPGKLELLVVPPVTDMKLIAAAKNLPGVKVLRADSLNIVDIIGYRFILLPRESLEVIEKVYLKRNSHDS